MDKAKVAFIAVAVVALLGAIGLGVVAYTKFGAAAEARGERDDANRKLDNLYRSEVFPNQENVAAMDDVLAEFNDSRDAFTNNLDKANIALTPVGEKSPSAFQNDLVKFIGILQTRAPLVDGRKAVADGFAFGFDAYFGKDAMPASEEVPLLMQQLTITAGIVLEAYAAQISQITKIERDAKDKATLDASGGGRREAEPEPEPDPRARRGKSRKAVEEKAAPLFTSQPFSIEFSARQNALVDFLNRLGGSRKPFVVVKSISAKKAGEDLRKAPAVEATETASAKQDRERHARARPARAPSRSRRNAQEAKEEKPAARQPARESAAPPPAEMPPEMRVVSGPDIDPPLNVRLELEIFNFGVEAE